MVKTGICTHGSSKASKFDILNELIDQLLDPFLFFPQDKYLRHQKRSVRPPGLLAQRIGDNCDGRSPGSWIFTDIRLPALAVTYMDINFPLTVARAATALRGLKFIDQRRTVFPFNPEGEPSVRDYTYETSKRNHN